MSNDNSSIDEVFIEALEIDASIGVFDWEKQIKQKLIFDLSLICDFSAAAVSDEIADAIDYVAVCEEIERITLAKHYQLLEALAESITQSLFSLFNLISIDLKIRKPGAVAKTSSVGVRVKRTREQL
jgi:dihydroneopterin aldolase